MDAPQRRPREDYAGRIDAALNKVHLRGGNLDTNQAVALSSAEAQAYAGINLAAAMDALREDVHVVSERAEQAMQDHAKALTTASKASDRYARNLVFATWALAAATVVLVFATLRMAS